MDQNYTRYDKIKPNKEKNKNKTKNKQKKTPKNLENHMLHNFDYQREFEGGGS